MHIFEDAGKVPNVEIRRTVIGNFIFMLLNKLPKLSDFSAH